MLATEFNSYRANFAINFMIFTNASHTLHLGTVRMAFIRIFLY